MKNSFFGMPSVPCQRVNPWGRPHATGGLVLPLLVVALALGGCVGLRAENRTVAIPQIPSLAWEQRSDWMNVKEHGAVGDGVADDSAAIQALYDRLSRGEIKTVYFPPGEYRITRTLIIGDNVDGISIVGHGRDTVLAWDGEPGGSMYWSRGVHRSRTVGLTYDGRGKGGIGSEHRSAGRYETHLVYQHCAFLNLDYGIAVNKNPSKAASAEIRYDNCLFQNCGTGVLLNEFNDYDNWFTRCAFVDCGVGLHSRRGNYFLYACSFERSREVDVRQELPAHSSSMRLCTSSGSRRFFETNTRHYGFAIQDCRIDSWTGEDGAIVLAQRGPTTIFDCVFTNPPNTAAPIRLANTAAFQQALVVSNNRSDGTESVVDPGPNSRVVDIPPGKRGAVLTSAAQRFLSDTARADGRIFDAKRDFGAAGDGKADDTEAIRRTLAAARDHGRGAVAYLPYGRYRITDTIEVAGADYAIESTGWGSALVWDGAAGGTMMRVRDPRDIRIANLQFTANSAAVCLQQVSDGGASSVFYDVLYIANPYDPNPAGMELIELPARARVRMGFVIMPLRIVDCGRATILADVHLLPLSISGAKHPKTGLTGFLFHNDACHNYALEVKDNQDVVIANFYSEQNQRYLLAEGGERPGDGRITLGAQKMSTKDTEMLTLRDYQGRIFIGGGGVVWFETDHAKQLVFAHQGTRPASLILVGNSYWEQEPEYAFGPGLDLVSLGNVLIGHSYPKLNEATVPNRPDPPTAAALAEVAAAFDHFRELGEAYLRELAR